MNDNYYHNKSSVDEYIKLAEGVNGAALIDQLKEVLPSGATLLELGSGPGSDFELLKKDYKVTGSDFSLEFLDRLKSKYGDDEFLNLDAITLETTQKFDAIYSNKVLQHLNDADLGQSIQKQVEILNGDGIICHSFWKGDGDEVFKGMLVNYQTEESLKALFDEAFEIIVLQEYAEFDEGDSLLLIGKKR